MFRPGTHSFVVFFFWVSKWQQEREQASTNVSPSLSFFSLVILVFSPSVVSFFLW